MKVVAIASCLFLGGISSRANAHVHTRGCDRDDEDVRARARPVRRRSHDWKRDGGRAREALRDRVGQDGAVRHRLQTHRARGTAGKLETIEIRSDGAFTIKDAFSTLLRSGTAPIVEIAPLARLVVRPELAALGPAYVDRTPAPSVMETDYDLVISKTMSFQGAFHEKTPSIISAIASEITRVTSATIRP